MANPPTTARSEPPGSQGEPELQSRYQTQDRARRFYRQQVLDRLNQRMVQFIGRQEMVWIATADAHGACDCSLRAGPPGFVQVLDDRTVGTARIVEAGGNRHGPGPRVERWVEVRVQEAYIHCRKHLPHLVRVNGAGRDGGTDDAPAKGGDYFGTSCEPRPWSSR